MSLRRSRGVAAAQAVVFDVDGVLIATPHERAWREALDELMATDWGAISSKINYAPGSLTTGVYQERVAGKPRESGARAVLDFFGVPEPGERATMYAARKQQRIDRLIAEGAFEAYPDAVRFVLALREREIRLAAASSSRNANHFMQAIRVDTSGPEQPSSGSRAASLRLLDLFTVNVSGRDVPRGKPYPDLFLLAVQELQVPPSSALVVEDATAGIQAAKRGGMRALGVARLQDQALLEAAGADLVVTSLDEVDLDHMLAGNVARLPSAANRAPASTRQTGP
jgi:beta-phosphoglucomutase